MSLLKIIAFADLEPGEFVLLKKQPDVAVVAGEANVYIVWCGKLVEANVPRSLQWDFIGLNPNDMHLAHLPIQP